VSGPWTFFVAALDKGQCRKAVCRRHTLAYIFILLPSILEVPYCVHWTKTVYHERKKLRTLYYVQYVFLIKGTVQRDGSFNRSLLKEVSRWVFRKIRLSPIKREPFKV
jgi:hypothetical protein